MSEGKEPPSVSQEVLSAKHPARGDALSPQRRASRLRRTLQALGVVTALSAFGFGLHQVSKDPGVARPIAEGSRNIGEKVGAISLTDAQKDLKKELENPPEERIVRDLICEVDDAKLRNVPSTESSVNSERGKLQKGDKVDLALKVEGPDPEGHKEKSTWYGFVKDGTPYFSHSSNFSVETH
ncbi:MAG: hypothetical protein NUV69_05825 [Candidatus Curtissbacteria bacterium]|nr:hypothetical protein [Candidatus Curtissbacteria bacterium]